MKALNQVICPISFEKIDSTTSRLTVFFNVMLMVMFLVTLNPVFIIGVSIDYLIRATFSSKYSPIKQIATGITSLLSIKSKPIDLAPKVFASRLGFLCALSASILFFTGNTSASIIVTSMLLVLSFMDSVFNFCVGCIIYHYLVFPFFKNESKS